ncbi:Astacin-like metalloprotease toxin, partial [Leptotrombidium deliense]
ECYSFATRVHEIMHAIGFFHHHNRPDRDEYLRINWDNISDVHKNDFKKLSAYKVKILAPFDYKSVMLYGPREFGKQGYQIVLSPHKISVVLKRL